MFHKLVLMLWIFLWSFQGLKSHAVTMFEVGKLSDESLDSFLAELEKVRDITVASV